VCVLWIVCMRRACEDLHYQKNLWAFIRQTRWKWFNNTFVICLN